MSNYDCHYGSVTQAWSDITRGLLGYCIRIPNPNNFALRMRTTRDWEGTSGSEIPGQFRTNDFVFDSNGAMYGVSTAMLQDYLPTGPEAGVITDSAYYNTPVSLEHTEVFTSSHAAARHILQLYKFDNPTTTSISGASATRLAQLDLIYGGLNQTDYRNVGYATISTVLDSAVSHADVYRGNTTFTSSSSGASVSTTKTHLNARSQLTVSAGDGSSESVTIPQNVGTLPYPTSGWNGTLTAIFALEYTAPTTTGGTATLAYTAYRVQFSYGRAMSLTTISQNIATLVQESC